MMVRGCKRVCWSLAVRTTFGSGMGETVNRFGEQKGLEMVPLSRPYPRSICAVHDDVNPGGYTL